MAPLDFLSKLIAYYTKQDVPIISTATAAGLSIIYTLIYVIPFYLSAKTRPSPQLSRDVPSVIWARIRSVILSCFVTCIITVYVGSQYGSLSYHELLRLMGWWPILPMDVFKVTGLVMILFAGPLFERCVVEGELRHWLRPSTIANVLSRPSFWRAYVAGPISEEFVWRSMIIPLHLFAKFSTNQIIFITPLYFGIAHIHHCYEFKLTHPDTPLIPAILRSLFQFAFTSVFGFLAAFIFLRTGSLLAVILVHSFCNVMGLPRLWGKIEPLPVAVAPEILEKEDLLAQTARRRRSVVSVLWTISYYIVLVVGAYGFYENLFSLTDSSNSLIPKPGSLFGGR